MFDVSTNIEGEDSIPMSEMKPYDIGVIVESSTSKNGEIVMRTAREVRPEVMVLSSQGRGACWSGTLPVAKVRLLPKGTSITLTVK